MSTNTPGKLGSMFCLWLIDALILIIPSAFWGQSFVTELNRISAHSAGKFEARKPAGEDGPEAEKPSNGVEATEKVTDEAQTTQ